MVCPESARIAVVTRKLAGATENDARTTTVIEELGQAEMAHQVGKKSSETGERYLPEAAIKALSSKEYAATTRAKRKAKRQGKQFSKQPESIMKKTRRFR